MFNSCIAHLIPVVYHPNATRQSARGSSGKQRKRARIGGALCAV